MKITCVVGLPGSGKTHQIITNRQSVQWVVDDIFTLKELPCQKAFKFLDMLWIADPYFCRTSTRQRAHDVLVNMYGVSPEWRYFENAPEKCKVNVQHRADGRRVIGLINSLSKVYDIPPDVTPMTIWQPEQQRI